MSNEIRGVASSGTIYARLMNSSGQVWNTSSEAFEAYSAGNYADYDIPLTEQGNSGVYVGDFPSAITSAGTYDYFIHLQSGGSPAEGDTIINTGKIDWTGTAATSSTTGAMSGSDFRGYVLRKGFKRTDKDTELYEAVTDAVQEMRRRFMFDEAEADTTTTDTISTDGDFSINVESDFGLLLDVILEDGTTAVKLNQLSKSQFNEKYPDQNVTNDRGYPADYCLFAGQIHIGPVPDSTSYIYRKAYSARAGTITSSTTGVPFTNLYRDILADLTLSLLYEGLDEFDKAGYYRTKFESGFVHATRRETFNTGDHSFNVAPTNF